MKSLIFSFLIAAISVTGLSADYNSEMESIHGKIEAQRNQLQTLESEIIKSRRNINVLDKKEAELFRELQKLEKQIELKKNDISGYEKKAVKVNSEIIELNKKLEKARVRHSEYGGYLKDILTEYYYRYFCDEITPWYGMEPGLCYIIEKLADAPARQYKDIERNIKEYTELKKKLREEQENLVSLKEQVLRAQQDFIENKEEQLDILKKLKKSRQDKLEEVERLESEKNRLSSFIESLKKDAINLKRLKGIAADFENAKGELESPVDGAVISKFGRQEHPELNTYVINRGIKISPDRGEKKIKAVAGGEILYADAFSGMGNMVVINHGKNYYTIYGNLTELYVKEGEEIEMFTPVGRASDKPLYFELGRGQSPLDPQEWLKR